MKYLKNSILVIFIIKFNSSNLAKISNKEVEKEIN